MLIRRHPVRATETACHLVYAPVDAPLPELVRAAGAWWTNAECFKLAKGQVGLDHYEVRSWQGWHRHITLALLALAALAKAAKKGEPAATTMSRSPFPNSVASSSASSGPFTGCPPRPSPGPAGGVGTSELPRTPTAAVA